MTVVDKLLRFPLAVLHATRSASRRLRLPSTHSLSVGYVQANLVSSSHLFMARRFTMESSNKHKLMAGVLSVALLLPATTAFGNDWSKPKSRVKGTAIGLVAGAAVAGPPGAVIRAAVRYGVQSLRHNRHAARH